MRRVLLIAVVLVLVGGCTGAGGGPAEPTGLSLPPRPRDLRIDGVEPCSLLTEQQRAELGLDGTPRSSRAPSVLFGGDEAACNIRGFSPRAVSVGLGLVTTSGIERFAAGELDAAVQASSVEGYPAVVAAPTRVHDFCSVLVDVAPGQLLDIQFADGGRQPPISQDRLCTDAGQVAQAAMQTLIAR
jgi:hypothetical protein